MTRLPKSRKARRRPFRRRIRSPHQVSPTHCGIWASSHFLLYFFILIKLIKQSPRFLCTIWKIRPASFKFWKLCLLYPHNFRNVFLKFPYNFTNLCHASIPAFGFIFFYISGRCMYWYFRPVSHQIRFLLSSILTFHFPLSFLLSLPALSSKSFLPITKDDVFLSEPKTPKKKRTIVVSGTEWPTLLSNRPTPLALSKSDPPRGYQPELNIPQHYAEPRTHNKNSVPREIACAFSAPSQN